MKKRLTATATQLMVSGLIALCLTASTHVVAAQERATMVLTVTGRDGVLGSLSPRAMAPTNPAVAHPQLVLAVDRHDIRLSNGQIVSAVAFEGWKEGAAMRVKVWAMVPSAGIENKYIGMAKMADLHAVEVATRKMTLADKFKISDIHVAGLDGWTVSVEPKSPKTGN